jgi:hypothetical protein
VIAEVKRTYAFKREARQRKDFGSARRSSLWGALTQHCVVKVAWALRTIELSEDL